MDWVNGIKVGLAGFLTAIATWMGGWDAWLEFLLVAMALDYAAGTIAAIKCKEWKYDTALWGIAKKIVICGVIILAWEFDKAKGTDIIHLAATFFYIATESISFLKNVGAIGVEIPGFLLDLLTKLKDASGTMLAAILGTKPPESTPTKPKGPTP